jgi:predicted porin
VTKLGFKGAEDMGDGLSAIWQIEQQIDIDNSGATAAQSGTSAYLGQATFATRNSFLGLSDKAMGTVLVGKYDTPYKISTRSLDPFDSTIADSRSLTGGTAAVTGGTTGASVSAGASFDGRQGNVLAYMSPSMAGFTVAAAQVFGAEAATAGTADKGSASSIAGMFKSDALYATVAYEVHNFGTANSGTVAPTATTSVIFGQKESAIKAGVGFTIADLALSAVYERTSDTLNAGASLYDHNSAFVSAKYNLSSANAVKVAYTRLSQINSVADTGANQISVGFDHNMSKRTSVFALYTALRNDAAANYGLTTAGSTGGTGALGSVYNGVTVSALALGMKHVF